MISKIKFLATSITKLDKTSWTFSTQYTYVKYVLYIMLNFLYFWLLLINTLDKIYGTCCLSKESWPISYNNKLLYKLGPDFLDMRYKDSLLGCIVFCVCKLQFQILQLLVLILLRYTNLSGWKITKDRVHH